MVKNDLGDLEIFLENLYAVHSIEHRNLDHHFYVFGVREHDRWLSWEETKFYANMLDLPTVPELQISSSLSDAKAFEQEVLSLAADRGSFEPFDIHTEKPTTIEGIVSRNTDAYTVDRFSENVFKYVRKGHVKTDEHWTRNWKRARLNQEGGRYVDYQ